MITDTKTGELLALVSYPGYDNNRLANTVDAAYFASLNSDLSKPLYNYATQEKTAPGSTFKMVSSVAGLVGVERLSAYSASKAGVIGLTRSLGKEYAPFNVRVNAIAPGYIEDTGMVNRIPEKQMSKFSSQIAMKRLGKVEEIAATVAFLASEDASYITGQTVVVDGGLS